MSTTNESTDPGPQTEAGRAYDKAVEPIIQGAQAAWREQQEQAKKNGKS